MNREELDDNEPISERYLEISKKEIVSKEEIELTRFILDFSYSIEDRIFGFQRVMREYPENIKDIVFKICGIYFSSSLTEARDILIEFTKLTQLDPYLRFEIAKSLCGEGEIETESLFIREEDISLGYLIFEGLCRELIRGTNLTPNCRFDYLYFLGNRKEYSSQFCFYFIPLSNDNSIDIDYRYKAILGIENKIKDKDLQKYYFRKIFLAFLRNKDNLFRYRILASQYLLQNHLPDDNEKKEVEEYLLSVANDDSIDYNVRADATDVLLSLGSPENKEIARDLIVYLGGLLGRKPITLFDNAQNVHSESIESSALEILEMLNQKVKTMFTFEQINSFIRKEIKGEGSKLPKPLSKEDRKKVKITLNRISNDRALYGKYNNNLKSILTKVYSFIFEQEEDVRNEYLKRLIEEMIDISGTCSTGGATRLVNVLSGLSEYSIKISWEDQVIGNFDGRLRARIRDMSNNPLKRDKAEDILIEMTLSNYAERGNFLEFYRENLSSLRDELWKEFRGYISDTDFDLYFYKAMLRYEGSD